MLYAIVAVIILILDQAVKYWTTLNIALQDSKPFIPGFIELMNVHNTGAAFNILDGKRWFFVILTLLFTAAVIYILSRNIIKGKLGRWMLVMVTAGGLGNCIDRTINGYVVDMFHFEFAEFAVFNVADIFVTVCGIIFCLYIIFHKEPADEDADKLPEKAPPRPLPRATERPIRNPDYITQLKKPVIEGRKTMEAEAAAKRAESSPTRNIEGSFTDWNIPEFDESAKPAPAVKPAPKPNPEPKEQVNPASAPKPTAPPKPDVFEELSKKPSQPAKKSGTDFTLEDIIAEFKD